MSTQTLISLENVSKTFRDRKPARPAIDHLTLKINAGEFFVFLGPSGCGKSTLLRLMSGLDTSYQGHISWFNSQLPDDVGFVFQQFALLPWLTVKENIALNLIGRHVAANKQMPLIHRQLERFHLEKFAEAYPKELSGGLRQRVGLARALAAQPKILFLDEPFSELDSATAAQLRQELLRIWASEKLTIVMVTHLVSEAIQLSDRIAVLSPRPATLKTLVHNSLPRPRPTRSASFWALEDRLLAAIDGYPPAAVR